MEEDLVGAAVTDSAAVGGAAITRALEVLDREPSGDPMTSIAPGSGRTTRMRGWPG
jgi:hypothetical protein